MMRVQGHPNLYRDEKSGAIVNCDDLSYNQYVISLENRQNQKKEIEQLKDEIGEIKNLLQQLLQKNGSI
jgi:hypothetical protein